jgi:hypothetical protein
MDSDRTAPFGECAHCDYVGGQGILSSVTNLPVPGQGPHAKEHAQDRPPQERTSPASNLQDACQRVTDLPMWPRS